MFEFWKKEESEIVAPVDGVCIRLEDVPDEAFSTGKMGEGFAVRSTGDTVVAPVDGTIVMIPETHHSFGMETRNGAEVLVHTGLNTVRMLGEGFTVLAEQGDTVKAGTPVIRFDRKLLESRDRDLTVIVTFTSGRVKMDESCFEREVKAGEVLVK